MAIIGVQALAYVQASACSSVLLAILASEVNELSRPLEYCPDYVGDFRDVARKNNILLNIFILLRNITVTCYRRTGY